MARMRPASMVRSTSIAAAETAGITQTQIEDESGHFTVIGIGWESRFGDKFVSLSWTPP